MKLQGTFILNSFVLKTYFCDFYICFTIIYYILSLIKKLEIMKKVFIPLLCIPLIFSTCKEEEITGCTESSSLNYNSEANLNDGSCIYFYNGDKCSSTSDGGYIFGGSFCRRYISWVPRTR